MPFHSSRLLILTSLMGTLSVLSAREATIDFHKGQPLTGELKEIGDKHVVIQHPDFKNAVKWDITKLKSVSLDKTLVKKNELRAIGKATLYGRKREKLKNDVYLGGIESIDDQYIHMDTAYAGKLKLKREFVQSLDIKDSKKFVFEGPGKLKSWKGSTKQESITEEEGAIHFKRGSGSRTREIYREIKFPDKYEIMIESEGRIRDKNFDLSLHTGNEKGAKNRGLSFRVSGYDVSVRLGSRGATRENRFQYTDEIRNLSGKLKFQFFVDLKKNEFSAYINGIKTLDRCKLDKLDVKKLGSDLNFRLQNQYTDFKLSKLHVLRWGGNFPRANSSKRLALRKREGQLIKLHNGDFIYGKIDQIKDGVAIVTSDYGTFKLKLAYISNLDLGKAKINGIRMSKNDARLHFVSGSAFIVNVTKIEEGKIYATSPAFEGTLAFEISQLLKIEFQDTIYPRHH